MANVYAVSAGNWSTPARWNTGSLPTSADDVYANGFAITIDQDITVVSIQTRSNTGIAAGGSFTASTSRTINASIYAGTTSCLTLSGTSLTFNVNAPTIQGPNAASNLHGITGGPTTSTINITATNTTGGSGSTIGNSHGINCGGLNSTWNIISTNITGGSGTGNNCYGINYNFTTGTPIVTLNSTTINSGTGNTSNFAIAFSNTVAMTYNVSGNVVANNSCSTIQITSSATTTINWNGNVTGGTGGNSIFGINCVGTLWTLNLTGDVTGGSGGSTPYGIYHNSVNGVINVIGTTYGGTAANGCYNANTGILRVRTTQASTSYSGLVGSTSTGTTTFEQGIFASNGLSPFGSFCKLKAGSNNYITCQKESGTLTLIDTANASAGYPSASDVRLGTAYNFGNTTGTLAVPLRSQVLSGVATDNTTGTFTGATVPTASDNADAVWNRAASALTTSGSIGERAKNLATTQDVGNLITSLI